MDKNAEKLTNMLESLESTGISRSEEGMQFLTFKMNDEEYGIDILNVQEIRCWESATAIPNSPDFIKGVINIRGTVVPIVGLRSRFGLPNIECGPTTVVIVVKIETHSGDKVMGIVVDAVSDVYSIKGSDIQPSPEVGEDIVSAFISGLARTGSKMVILLDLEKLLDLQIASNREPVLTMDKVGETARITETTNE